MTGWITIEEVFNVSFVEGVMVVGLSEGDVGRGDAAELERSDGLIVRGEIGAFHVHLTENDPDNRIRVEIRGPLAETVKAGDRVATSRPSAIPRAVGPEA